MKWLATVRGRVFAALALTAVVCTVLTVLVASLVLTHQAHQRRLVNASRVADVVAQLVMPRADGGTQVVRLSTLNARRAKVVRGAARTAILDATAGRAVGTTGFAAVAGRRVVVAVRDEGAGRVVLTGPSGDKAVTGPSPGPTVLLAGAGGLLVALLLGGLLTRRLTAPVAAVTSAAQEVAAGRTDLRVPEQGALEFRQLGASFNAMVGDLETARAAERRFLTSVSHELKTPLTAVRGYAEAIADGAMDPVAAAAVIGQEAARLERLVGDLLDLARLGQADFAVARDPLDLAGVARAAVDRHALVADELGVRLMLDAPGDAPGVGDTGRALQVVSNLIENAVRVARTDGTVTVIARAGVIEVVDDGPGLRPEEIPRAFERFYLYDRLRSDRPVGSGLGLALVAELVAGMGGQASVTSVPRVRTTFRVELDATPAGGPQSGEMSTMNALSSTKQ